MEYLQYLRGQRRYTILDYVLNLIITGIPSILYGLNGGGHKNAGFKPYYNWNTFNTEKLFKLSWNTS